MVKCLVFVAEVIVALPDEYSIAASMIIHSWQSGLRVGLPRMNHVPHVLRRRHLAQILNFIIRRVEVYVVQLHCGKMPVMPSPDGTVHQHLHPSALKYNTKHHILPTGYLFSLYGPARLPVHELSAAVVVVVILLDASHQCGQLAIR